MKVETKRQKIFFDLDEGEVFRVVTESVNSLYLKIQRTANGNAVDLQNGCLHNYASDCRVEVVGGKFIEE